jgi:hypothetical protein
MGGKPMQRRTLLVKKYLFLILLIACISAAYADVARSTDGEGPTETQAVIAAKRTATKKYGDKIKSWGKPMCDQVQAPPGQGRIWWVCSVDFTTTDD